MKLSPTNRGQVGLGAVFLILVIMILAAVAALLWMRNMRGTPVVVAPTAAVTKLADGWGQAHLYHRLVSEQVPERNFAELDQIAARLRRGERQASGTWLLPEFYEGLVGGMDGDVVARRTLLEQWHNEIPESQTAVVALAEWWIDYAWKARGAGWANTVNDESWKLFAERLDVARRTLCTLNSKDVICPHWYHAMLTVALGESWSDADYDKVYNEAITRWPDYYSFYFQKSHHLLPRWGGRPGQWEAYAEDATKGHPDGDMLYARIVWSKAVFYQNVFGESNADWPRTRRGMEGLLALYPASGWNLAYACSLALDAGDYATLAKWSPGLRGIAVPNAPLTPGLLAFGEQMAADPSHKQPKETLRWKLDGSECRAVIFLTDSLVAMGTRDGGVFLGEIDGNSKPRLVMSMRGPVAKFALSPDGNLLAIAQGSLSNSQKKAGSGMAYDWRAEKEVAKIEGWKGTVTEVAFSNDGNTLFLVGGVSTQSAEWKAWDRYTGKIRSIDWANDRGDALVSVSTHPSKPLVAVDWGNSVRVWDYETGKQVLASAPVIQPGNLYYAGQAFIGQVWSVRFSPDGGQLIAGACPSMMERASSLGGITAWKVEGQDILPDGQTDHFSGADRVRFSPDGRRTLSSDQEAMLILRDAATRKVETIFPSRQKYVLDLAFSPDGRRAATAGRDGSVVVWEVPPR